MGRTRARFEELGRRAWALVGIAIVIALIALFISRLAWLLAPAVATVVFAVLAAPVVGWISPRGRARIWATVVVFLVLFAVICVAGYVIGPAFTNQVARLTIDIPDVAEDLASQLDSLETTFEGTSPSAANAVGQFRVSLVERSESFGADLADNIFGLVGSVIGIVLALVIGLVIAFMVVKDLPSLTRRTREWMMRPENLRIHGGLRAMARTTTGFIRGQLIVAVIVGIIETLALWMLGIPYFVPLGVLAGVGNLVPGVGPVLVAIPPVVIAVAKGGWGFGLLVLGVIIVIQIVNHYWFMPMLVGSKVKLPTLVTIIALIVGAGLAGFVGLIIAVPIAAAVKEAVHWLVVPDDELKAEVATVDAELASARRYARFRVDDSQ